jgi:ribonuclease J
MNSNVSAKENDPVADQGFYFVPLGGSEQFGVNFNLYACQGKWLAMDCGIGFADERFPNVDILLPDPAFIEDRLDDLLGLVVTHAHEDHVGAVPYLWPRLRCPIYCTKFTAAVLRAKFNDFPSCKNAKIIEIEDGQALELDPFRLHFIGVSHSIPEAVSTVIETPLGRVVHTGDWNSDPTPVIGKPTDPARFRKFGDEGILAYIGDSTNCLVNGRGGSETDVQAGLEKLFAECSGRISITIFASNVGRIHSIAKAARAVGRSVCLLGRSLHRMVGAAKACGYLHDIPDFVAEEDTGYISSDKILYIVTGSQGEAPAALARIARGEWPDLHFTKGDTVIFSSRAIPGNEKNIIAVKNNLSASKVKIIDPDSTPHKIHVSGHPYRDEVKDMLNWLRPGTVIPVHGERLMLDAQAELAESIGIKQTIVPINGALIRLAPGVPQIVDHIETGLLAVEPQRIVRSGHKGLAERRKLQYSGAVHVTVALNRRGDLMMDPQVTMVGLVDHDDAGEMDIVIDIRQEIEDTLVDLREEDITDPARIEEDIRVAVRRLLTKTFGFKPKVSVHLLMF